MRSAFAAFSVIITLGVALSATAPAATVPACPLSGHYCQAGTAESGFPHDYAPPAVRSRMRRQFMPQCASAMISRMGPGAKPVAGAFCTCAVDSILATPGEWHALTASARMNPKKVAALDAALATQTMAQEKGCMLAIAAGTGMIAPKAGTAPTRPNPASSSAGNGFSRLLGAPYGNLGQ